MRIRNCSKVGACLVVALALILAAQSFAAKGRSTSPAGNGTIEGTVTGMKGMSVVYVEAIPGKTFQAPEKHAFVDEKELGFIPHILAIQQGTTTDFLNSDKVQHNVSWPSIGGNKKLARNLGTLGTGERRSFKFDTSGLVELLCNCHQEMAGFILVSPTPYFAVTDASGNYSIKDVPDGSYMVTVWHENAKSKSQQVQVVAGNAKVDFEIERK
jgi:plastocyanin